MKKLFCLLMVIAMLLCGCSTRVKPQIDISEKYYYMPTAVTFDNGSRGETLARFNVENGRITPLCPDPLCDHDTECPFFGVVNYTVDGDIIWFQRYMIDENTDYICQYDISNGKLRTLAKYEDDGYSYAFKFGYLWKYFSHNDPTDNDLSVRISLSEENFDDPEKIDPSKIPFAQVGDIYYYAVRGAYNSPATEVRAMYADLTDDWRVADDVFSMNFTYYNGYVYYIEKEALLRVSVDEAFTGVPANTKEPVKDNVGAFFFSNDMLYYLQNEGADAEVIGWDEFLEEEVKNTYGGKIWRANPDGSKAKVFTETDGYVISKSILSNAQVGSRLVVRYGCWKEKQRDGETLKAWRTAEGGLLVVNLDDGTYEAYSVFDE